MIYTTNAIEGFNRQLRKVMKSKAFFPLMTAFSNCFTWLCWILQKKNWETNELVYHPFPIRVYFANRLEKCNYWFSMLICCSAALKPVFGFVKVHGWSMLVLLIRMIGLQCGSTWEPNNSKFMDVVPVWSWNRNHLRKGGFW